MWDTGKVGERLRFFGALLRNPARVGAVVPSSPALAREMARACDLQRAHTVVELGAGTGSLTREILRQIGPDTLFIALEIDERIAADLRKKFPGVVVYQESAAHLPACLARHGRTHADCILSGLPFASLPTTTADSILQAIFASLKPGGAFVMFTYLHSRLLPGMWRFREHVTRQFRDVTTSGVVWNNVPPAVVVRYR